MAIAIRKLHHANVYLNGEHFAGIASEVTLPEVKAMVADHSPTCLNGKVELAYGLDKLKLVIKGDFDPAFVMVANDFYHQQHFTLRSVLTTTEDGEGRTMQSSVAVHVRGMFQGYKAEAFKNDGPTEVEYNVSCTYLKVEVDGVPIQEINLLKNTHKVAGNDLNDIQNALLGIN